MGIKFNSNNAFLNITEFNEFFISSIDNLRSKIILCNYLVPINKVANPCYLSVPVNLMMPWIS